MGFMGLSDQYPVESARSIPAGEKTSRFVRRFLVGRSLMYSLPGSGVQSHEGGKRQGAMRMGVCSPLPDFVQASRRTARHSVGGCQACRDPARFRPPAALLGGRTQLCLGRALPAYGQNELLTSQYYVFHAAYLRKVAALPVLVGKGVYLNASAEVGKVFSPPFQSRVPADGALALVVDTIFGPVEVGG